MTCWFRYGLMALAFGFGSIVAGLVSAPDVRAEAAKKEQSLREKYALPTHIQLLPMMVPIKHRYQSVSAISMFLEANIREEVGAICRKVPKVRDAILGVLSRHPIPTRRNKMILTGLNEKLFGPINRALGRTGIKSIHIEPGAIRLATKGGISRLPFAAINGCKGIKEIELEIVKARQKEKAKEK